MRTWKRCKYDTQQDSNWLPWNSKGVNPHQLAKTPGKQETEQSKGMSKGNFPWQHMHTLHSTTNQPYVKMPPWKLIFKHTGELVFAITDAQEREFKKIPPCLPFYCLVYAHSDSQEIFHFHSWEERIMFFFSFFLFFKATHHNESLLL
jgi:hypothetical protein